MSRLNIIIIMIIFRLILANNYMHGGGKIHTRSYRIIRLNNVGKVGNNLSCANCARHPYPPKKLLVSRERARYQNQTHNGLVEKAIIFSHVEISVIVYRSIRMDSAYYSKCVMSSACPSR